jgi:hypothetical protein
MIEFHGEAAVEATSSVGYRVVRGRRMIEFRCVGVA